MRDMSRLTPPERGSGAPVTAEPAPQGVTGTLDSLAQANNVDTSFSDCG